MGKKHDVLISSWGKICIYGVPPRIVVLVPSEDGGGDNICELDMVNQDVHNQVVAAERAKAPSGTRRARTTIMTGKVKHECNLRLRMTGQHERGAAAKVSLNRSDYTSESNVLSLLTRAKFCMARSCCQLVRNHYKTLSYIGRRGVGSTRVHDTNHNIYRGVTTISARVWVGCELQRGDHDSILGRPRQDWCECGRMSWVYSEVMRP